MKEKTTLRPAKTCEPARPDPMHPGPELRILQLEDSADDAELVMHQLRHGGISFTAERVATREAFVNALARFRPDIVLADFLLPGFDGMSAVNLVRGHDPDLPVIVVTGVLGDEAAVGLMQAGANDYVLKDRVARLPIAVQKAVAAAEQSRAHRRAQDALRLSEERYHSLIAATAQMVWTTGPLGQVTDELSDWRAYTGQSAEQVRHQGWLDALDPDSRAEVIEAWTRAVQSGKCYEGEWRLRRRDGLYGYFSTRAVPLHDASGAIREWIGCNIDITERKRYEQELERRNREMRVIRNLSDMLQACNSREEAYPFVAMAGEELLAGSSGALVVPGSGASHLLEKAVEWGESLGWIAPDFSFEDCWGVRRGAMNEPSPGTECRHFLSNPPEPYVCLPLLVRGEISGQLTIALPGQVLSEEVKAEIAAFGDTLALCLANLKLRETLQKQAIRDPMTGLLSAQYLKEWLPREIRQAERHHECLTVAALEIEHFEEITAAYGGAAGDQLLSQIGEILCAGLGTCDLACRQNSGDFVLVFVGDRGASRARVHRICEEIRNRAFRYRGQDLPRVRLAAGLAEPAALGTAADLIRSAFQAARAPGGAVESDPAPVAALEA